MIQAGDANAAVAADDDGKDYDDDSWKCFSAVSLMCESYTEVLCIH